MKLKRTLSAFGVLTVAIAALASGPAAAFADENVTTDDMQIAAVAGKLVIQNASGTFSPIVNDRDKFMKLAPMTSTLAAAEAAADTFTVPAIGSTAPIKSSSGKCASVRQTGTNVHWIDLVDCTGMLTQNWKWEKVNGGNVLTQWRYADSIRYATYAQDNSGGVLPLRWQPVRSGQVCGLRSH